jgi:hypothetical protein
MSRKEPEPKIAIFPTKFNFRRYETARRISEQEDINTRPNKRVDDLPGLLERYSKRSSGTRGINRRNLQEVRKIGVFDVNVVAEYTLDNKVDSQQNLLLFKLFFNYFYHKTESNLRGR